MRFSSPIVITALAYGRLKVDAAGGDVRDLLGAGEASVIPADHLGRRPLPPRPFVAYRAGPVPTVSEVDIHNGAWLIYDDLSEGSARIDELAAQIVLAYDAVRGAPPLPSPAGPVRLGPLSEPRNDAALSLTFRRFDLTIDA